MAYDRINWENTPSTNTPLNADNLNTMDAALANLDNLIAAANELITELQSAVSLLDARMDTFVTLQDGSTAGDAEIADARIDSEHHNWGNLGDSIRGQIKDTWDVAVVADEEPTREQTKIWIKPDEEEVIIPTMEDLNGLVTVEGTKLIIGGNNGQDDDNP